MSGPGQMPNITQAKYELMAFTGLFNSLTESCFNQCVTRFSEKDIKLGEITCVDRCVVKYMQAQAEVGKVLQEKQTENAQLQQQQQQ